MAGMISAAEGRIEALSVGDQTDIRCTAPNMNEK
jgi:hypothetical protein